MATRPTSFRVLDTDTRIPPEDHNLSVASEDTNGCDDSRPNTSIDVNHDLISSRRDFISGVSHLIGPL